MTVVGQATVEIQPNAAGFGPKTEAAVKAALAGISGKIDLTLDNNGLRQKIEAAVKVASAGIRADIETNLNVDPLKGKIKQAVAEAAAEASSAGGGQLDLFDVDPAQLVAEVVAAKEAARAALAAGKQLELDLDFHFENARAQAEAALETSLAGLGGRDIEIPLNVDSDHLGAEVEAAIHRAEAGKRIKIPLDAGGGDRSADTIGAAVGGTFGRAVLRTAARVLAAGGIAQLLTAADAGAVALGGALISAASAAGSLAGVAATLPGLFSAAAQAAGTIVLALGGIKGAFQAYTAMQKAVGKEAAGGSGGGGGSEASARAAERAIRNATRGIEDAQRSAAEAVEAATERISDSLRDLQDTQRDVADSIEAANERVADSIVAVSDAQQNLADTYEDSARRVEDAERAVARAHRNSQDAQEALTRAREQAREEADDLRRSVERLSLSEAEARRRLQEAQTRQGLAQKRAQQDLTGVTEETLRALERQADLEDKAAVNPREKAANDLRDAELDLQEVLDKRADTEAKLAEADRTGVEGSQKVIDAKEKVADANQAVIDSERDLARTQRDTARAIVDAQDRVSEAIKDQTKAQRELVRAQEDGSRRLEDAQRRVLESQRDLVKAQEDGARRIADAQEALADAIESAAERAAAGAAGATGAINAYEAALERLSPAARHFVEFLVSLEPRLKRIQAIAGEGLLPGLETAITNLLPLLDDFEPIIFSTGTALAGLAIQASKLVTSPAWRSDLAELGRRNITIIETLGRASLSTADFMRNVILAAGPLTQHIADLVENLAGLAANAAQVGRDNGKMEAYFRRVGERLDKMLVTVGLLTHALFNIFKEATPAGDRYLDTLERLAAKFDLLVERAKNSGQLREFFDSTKPVMEAVGRLLGDIASALVRIGASNFGTFSTFVDELRTVLLPVLEEILSTIDTGFLSSLVNLAAGLGKLFEALLGGNPALTVLVNVLAGMAEGFAKLLTDIPILSPLLLGLVTTLSALGTVAAVIKIEQLAARFSGSVAGIELLSGAFKRFGSTAALTAAEVQAQAVAVEGAAAREAAAVAAGFEAVEAKVGLAGRAIGLLGKGLLIAGLFYGVKQAIDAFLPSMAKVASTVESSATPLADFEAQLKKINNPSVFDQLLIGIKHPVDGAKILLSQLSLDFKQADKDIDAAMKNIGLSGTEGFRKLAEASQGAALRVIADAKAQGRNTEEYERILDSLIEEKAKQGIAEEDVRKRIDAATAALKGNTSELERNIARMKDATSQALSLSGAEISTEEAIDRLTTSIAENGNTFDVHTEKGRNNKRALDDVVRSIQAEIGELGKAAAAGGIDNARKQELINHLDELARSGYPGAAAQAENLRGQLNAIEGIYTAVVNLDTRQAEENLAALQRNLNAVENASRGSVDDVGTTTGNQREFGGRVERNRSYIVGEKRPELFVPDVSGTILPTVPDLASLVPFGVSQSIGDINLMPASSNFDVDGVVESLRRLEESLTERLSDVDDRLAAASRRDAPVQTDGSGGVTVEQTINGPLVTIEATFGPGSAATDIIEAMRAIARDELSGALAQVLREHGAGAGTRSA